MSADDVGRCPEAHVRARLFFRLYIRRLKTNACTSRLVSALYSFPERKNCTYGIRPKMRPVARAELCSRERRGGLVPVGSVIYYTFCVSLWRGEIVVQKMV